MNNILTPDTDNPITDNKTINNFPNRTTRKSVPEFAPDGKPWPKISIVTVSFNMVDYIEDTILSVISQEYPNLEYIVIDGGSKDGTVDIIKKYEQWITYWISEPDSGMYDAINKGFKHATGEIMAYINSDDKFHYNAFFSADKRIIPQQSQSREPPEWL